AAEGLPGEAIEAALEALRLIDDTAPERSRPIALDEIVAAIEQQQPGIVEVAARPGRHVQRRTQPVAGLDRRDEPLLEVEHGVEPELAQQHVARSEAMIERALGGVQPLDDRIDGYRHRSALRAERAGRSQEVGMLEFRARHDLD